MLSWLPDTVFWLSVLRQQPKRQKPGPIFRKQTDLFALLFSISFSALNQAFLTLAWLTFGAGSFFVVERCPVYRRMSSSILGLYPRDAHSTILPSTTLPQQTLSPDTAKCFLGDWVGKMSSAESHHCWCHSSTSRLESGSRKSCVDIMPHSQGERSFPGSFRSQHHLKNNMASVC